MNYYNNLKSAISRNIYNIPGWRTERKILVIESDDWGSIRLSSRKAYEDIVERGIRIDNLSFNKYDALETQEDLECLYSVLKKFKDKNGSYPVFTANFVVTNPDFEKIQEEGFKKYYFESLRETLNKTHSRSRVFEQYMSGIKENIFRPQYHGREHVNISRWIEALKNNQGDSRFAFKHKMYDLSTSGTDIGINSFMDSLTYESSEELATVKDNLVEGAQIFSELFGYRSKSYIATCYTWDKHIEGSLLNAGILYIQGGYFQKMPVNGSRVKYSRKYHFLGQRNILGQIYLTRNCFFEPCETSNQKIVDNCIERIKAAFTWNKPAIISTHRVNYMGSIIEENRTQNLKLLEALISKVLELFPDVEFMSSDRLGDIIKCS